MKQKFIEWFTKNNNGCSPAMEDDRSFVYETTQLMFEAYQAGVAEGETTFAALAAEVYDLKHPGTYLPSKRETPATDAFLAEVRAHDLNAFIRHHSAELDAHIKNGGEQFDEKSVRIRDIIVSARLFREQIRKGVRS
ncbi:Uncharacterised protein [Escherichia coli]|uniref:hypothetical protein n=1 Tax=Escherichia coli TaxID=562 RepID=UPI000E039FAB|nr:hypothetical protein [Escherichia coli]STK12608.1 Uncharacterised protein [Escherichia coli]